jgi:hypothetical protein
MDKTAETIMRAEVQVAIKELVALTIRLGRDPIPSIDPLSKAQLIEATQSVVFDKINGRYPGVPSEELSKEIKDEIESYFKELEVAKPKESAVETAPVPEGVQAALDLYVDAMTPKGAVRIFQNTGKTKREIMISAANALLRHAMAQNQE